MGGRVLLIYPRVTIHINNCTYLISWTSCRLLCGSLSWVQWTPRWWWRVSPREREEEERRRDNNKVSLFVMIMSNVCHTKTYGCIVG